MKTHLTGSVIVFAILLLFTQCQPTNTNRNHHRRDCDTCLSYAVYAEFARDSNKPMQNGLNRRVFNIAEKENGHDIALRSDGSITLQAGTYRISGFSMVTMQASMVAEFQKENYPGYCLVYRKENEHDSDILQKQLCIGSPATSDEASPSLYDLVYTCARPTDICVGHQSGNDIPKGKIYLSVYRVDTTTSEYHVFSRIAITRLY